MCEAFILETNEDEIIAVFVSIVLVKPSISIVLSSATVI